MNVYFNVSLTLIAIANRHDFNDEFEEDSGFIMSQPDWRNDSVVDCWKTYAEAAFSKLNFFLVNLTCLTLGALSDGIARPVGQKKSANTKSNIKLELDGNDLPILPDHIPDNRADAEATIRQFLNGYYSKSKCRNFA